MTPSATAVVSSAEGAGDMPSSAPVSGRDSSEDGAQPFAEVLSLSSPDHPSSSDSAPPSDPSQNPGEAHDETETAAATVPGTPATHTAGTPRGRSQRRAGTSERGDGHARRPAGSAPLSPAGTADQTSVPSLPGSTPTQGEGAAIGVNQSLAPESLATAATPATATAATGTTASAATPVSPAAPLPSTTVVASTASDGLALSETRTEAPGGDDALAPPALPQDGSGPSTGASLPAHLPHAFGAGSTSDDGSRTAAVADVTGEGSGEVRGLADHGAAPGSAALRAGPVRIQANDTTPGAAASALSVASTGAPGTAAVSAEEVLELTELPDGAGGTTGLDVNNLAASISRPLAGGSGDYSVQVSLHPPELGEVRALLSLQGDVLHVTLTPEHSSGFDALSDAMTALHEQLTGGGVEVHVTLGQPGDPEGGQGRGAAEARVAGQAPSDEGTTVAAAPAIPVSTDGPGRIHLVL